jgi:Base plate wedge protein 53
MSNQTIYPATSSYYNTNIFNNNYLDVMIYRSIPSLTSDVYYIIPPVYQYRPDMLANDLYSDPRLWWVFAQRNPNRLGQDPYFNFVAGLGIYVPKASTLKQSLGI